MISLKIDNLSKEAHLADLFPKISQKLVLKIEESVTHNQKIKNGIKYLVENQ